MGRIADSRNCSIDTSAETGDAAPGARRVSSALTGTDRGRPTNAGHVALFAKGFDRNGPRDPVLDHCAECLLPIHRRMGNATLLVRPAIPGGIGVASGFLHPAEVFV